MDLSKVILRPLNSEKAYLLKEKNNQYVFEVATTATKQHIKQAFEAIFNVVPEAVNTVLRKPKPTRMVAAKRKRGYTKLIKIAYISLKPGIVLNDAEPAEAKTPAAPAASAAVPEAKPAPDKPESAPR